MPYEFVKDALGVEGLVLLVWLIRAQSRLAERARAGSEQFSDPAVAQDAISRNPV